MLRQFFKRRGLLVYSIAFGLLLVIHTVLFFSADVSSAVAEPAASAEESSEVVAETSRPQRSGSMILAQIALIGSGLPLLFLLIMKWFQTDKRLSDALSAIAANDKQIIFNSSQAVDIQNEDEIQRRLLLNLNKIRDFINAISGGDYNITWDGLTDKNKDSNSNTIAGALLQMRDKMQSVKEEDKIRIWTTEGLSKFGEIIRKYHDNFDKLSESLISNVVNYVNAKVGGLFILEEDEETNEKFLLLRACFAYERKKYLTKKVDIGEGLVGQCYLEAQTIYMAKVPNNYMSITSGLGGANPSSLLVIPLKTNDKIEGVLELASLKPFQPHEIEFLEKLAELLASSIVTVRTAERTNKLLRTSQEQAEEMRAQEEEMRQNMEELEATQEQMNRTMTEMGVLKENLEKEKYLLDALMDNIPDAIYFKDSKSKFIRVSKYLASHFSGSVEDLIGKSDFDFQDRARAQQAYDDEMNIMATRKPKIDYIEKEVMTDGTEHWVSTTKMPLINRKGEVVGTFGISRDVTRLKKLEADVLSRDKSLDEEKKYYENRIRSLEQQLKAS
jgi:PAS domain S-box-containing protein